MNSEYIVKSKKIITVSEKKTIIDGAMVIKGDKIIDIGKSEYILEKYKELEVEDSQIEVQIFDASSKKVLIVDDNKINLKVASRLLDAYNVQIETVESGFDCLEKLDNGSIYDLILMDDMMPRMSGVETFHRLRDKGISIPCVALTANAISGMKEKYLSEGFNDYLSKPIDKLELNIIMKKYLGK